MIGGFPIFGNIHIKKGESQGKDLNLDFHAIEKTICQHGQYVGVCVSLFCGHSVEYTSNSLVL